MQDYISKRIIIHAANSGRFRPSVEVTRLVAHTQRQTICYIFAVHQDILGILHVPTAHCVSEKAEQARSKRTTDPDTANMFTQVIIPPSLLICSDFSTCSWHDYVLTASSLQ